jgi:prepilin-type processing-associated H-X9-DG protein
MQALYQKIRFDMPIGATTDNPLTANTIVSQTVVATFLCPSDTQWNGIQKSPHNNSGPRAATNYKACAGANWAWGDAVCLYSFPKGRWQGSTDGLDQGNGFMCRNVTNNRLNYTTMADVVDGTSNAFALGEAVPEWCNHTYWYWFNAVTATCGIPLNYKSNDIRTVAGHTLDTNLADWPNNYSFYSRHPGGANFGYVDGSSRFISDTIDITAYRMLAMVADGGTVPQVP